MCLCINAVEDIWIYSPNMKLLLCTELTLDDLRTCRNHVINISGKQCCILMFLVHILFPSIPCYTNHLLLSMLSMRNPAWSYKNIQFLLVPTNTHSCTQTLRHMSKFIETHIITQTYRAQIFLWGMWTSWTLLCSVNITDPVVQTGRMHYETSDFLLRRDPEKH